MIEFNDEEKKHFKEHGYVLFKNIFSDEQVEAIRAIVVKLAEWEHEQGNAFYYGENNQLRRVWNLINKHQVFRDIIQQASLLDIMEYLFDRNTIHQKYLLSSFQANIISAGGGAQKLHIDTPVPDPLPPWMIKVNTIWMLDDFTENNGSTECLPGSHLFMRRPNAEEDQLRQDLMKVIAPKGSMLMIHGGLWHRSGQNQTDRDRIVLLGSFTASYTKEISNEEDHLQIIDQEIIDNASPALKKILAVGHGIKSGASQPPPLWSANDQIEI